MDRAIGPGIAKTTTRSAGPIVISGWHDIWSRRRWISPAELQTRFSQEVGKRLELILGRAEIFPSTSNAAEDPLTWGKFFFSYQTRLDIGRLLKQYLPANVDEIVIAANQACQHHFELLGHRDLDYTPHVDWHFDAANGKRAPLKPWFKVPFLDFSEVGDHKVIWELNRHQHLVNLAKAWVLTSEEKYVAELISQWYAWQIANPYGMGVNWASSLEVAFRSLSWLWIHFLLAECVIVPARFHRDLGLALAVNGRYIERYLSKYFSPNTHLLGEAVALFFIGTLCPWTSRGKRWRERGWQILLTEAERQVRSDGFYFEQSLYYHAYALDFWLHARILAARNELAIPATFDATIRKMLHVLMSVSQGAPPEGFGDDDGGRVFDQRRNRSQHLTDPLAVGAVLFGHEEFRKAASLTEEATWLFGATAISTFGEHPEPPQLRSEAFASSGIYVMANNGGCSQRMVIDGGPLGAGRGGHGHADALAVTLAMDGHSWLVDSGTFCYTSSRDSRNYFRGTGAHNTIRIDGRDQAEPVGPFAWKQLPNARVRLWLTTSSFSLFDGSHDGYSRLSDPVLHRRVVFYVHGRFWLVRDVITGKESHTLESNWHFAPDLEVRECHGAFVASRAKNHEGANNLRLTILPSTPPECTRELGSAYVSAAYGVKGVAPLLRFGARVQLPAEIAVLIAPVETWEEAASIRVLAGESGSGHLSPYVYRYDESANSHYYMMFAEGGQWQFGPLASNAQFLYCHIQKSSIRHLVLCSGSSLTFKNCIVMRHSQPVERLEWLNETGTARVECSDQAAAASFISDVLRNSDWVV